MDVPVEIVAAGYAAMAAGMAGLWRMQVKSQARCEANEIRMSKKIDALDQYQREELAGHANRSSSLAATALPLLDRAMRVIRRHEKTAHQNEDDTPLVNSMTSSPCG